MSAYIDSLAGEITNHVRANSKDNPYFVENDLHYVMALAVWLHEHPNAVWSMV